MSETHPIGTAERLYVLDYGLFEVTGRHRTIGIQGYLIQTEALGNILVDLGFPPSYHEDPASASRADGLDEFGRILELGPENSPKGQLALIDLEPDDIDVLVLTHTDIDHIGDPAQFNHARIVVGRPERKFNQPRELGAATQIQWPQGAEYELIDSDTQLAQGVMALWTPGHSPGHLSLMVRLPRTGPVLIAGDAISRPSEPDEGYGNAADPYAAAESASKLLEIARAEEAFIIYGHDPEQWPDLRKAPRYYD